MEAKSKFDTDESLFVMRNNEILKARIERVVIEKERGMKDFTISYQCNNGGDTFRVKEQEAHESKENLIIELLLVNNIDKLTLITELWKGHFNGNNK